MSASNIYVQYLNSYGLTAAGFLAAGARARGDKRLPSLPAGRAGACVTTGAGAGSSSYSYSSSAALHAATKQRANNLKKSNHKLKSDHLRWRPKLKI